MAEPWVLSVLCVWPGLVIEENVKCQIEAGENKEVIISPSKFTDSIQRSMEFKLGSYNEILIRSYSCLNA